MYDIHKNTLEDFFNDALTTDIDRTFKESIISDTKKAKEQNDELLQTNILYITTECNIACDYCYQKDDRAINPKAVMSKEQVTRYFEGVAEREPECTSTVVLFGGELFLEPEIVFFCIDEVNRIKREKGKKFALCITTNGIWFMNEKNRIKWMEVVKASENLISTEISFDGSGHDRRVYKNGKSTKQDVISVLKAFKEVKFPITIRYTVQRDNYKNVLVDYIKLYEFYKDFELPKIVPSIFYTELEEELGYPAEQYMLELKPKINAIYEKYKVPFCMNTCEACMKCNFEAFGDVNYRLPGTDESWIVQKKKQGNFDHFSQKVSNAK